MINYHAPIKFPFAFPEDMLRAPAIRPSAKFAQKASFNIVPVKPSVVHAMMENGKMKRAKRHATIAPAVK